MKSLKKFLSSIFLDKRIWILESWGKFSSKSFFKALIPSHNFDLSFLAKKIWKSMNPPRVNASYDLACLTESNQSIL